VPLSEAAMALLAALKREGDRVFPVSNMAMNMLLRRMGKNGLTVHGFRVDILGLGSRTDQCAVRSPRDGAGTHRGRQSGSRLSARRLLREAAGAG
jgi:hypothetical protein